MPNYVYTVYIGVQLVCLIINKDVKPRLLWAQCLCFLTLNQKQVQTLLMHRSCTVCPELPSHTRFELFHNPELSLLLSLCQYRHRHRAAELMESNVLPGPCKLLTFVLLSRLPQHVCVVSFKALPGKEESSLEGLVTC